jgi:hypothetical protein
MSIVAWNTASVLTKNPHTKPDNPPITKHAAPYAASGTQSFRSIQRSSG